jgi:uncharacterized membrane protein YpjA
MRFGKFSELSGRILGNKKILLFLAIANIAGFFAGIYFYREQLAGSNPLLWIVIMDSPISVLLFAVVCMLLYFNKKIPEALKLFASVYVIKYGIWTMLTLWLYRSNYVIPVDQIIGVADFILHFGMVLEGIVLIPKIRPRIRDTLVALLLCLTNDFFDYFLGTVTRIPTTYIDFLMLESFAVSIILTLSIFICQRTAGSKASSKL